jgi:hypothetical protein
VNHPGFGAHLLDWEGGCHAHDGLGVLKHGSYHETKGLGVDESVMWGEYFFVKTLSRVVTPT